MLRLVPVSLSLFFAFHAQAQGLPPAPPMAGGYAPQQGYASPGRSNAGGCYGCSYSGDYYGGNLGARRPAPPLRLQGQWRNGQWYY